ncbi:hypothetical protein NBRC116597_24840 [Phaeobacter sp. NW0010-22]
MTLAAQQPIITGFTIQVILTDPPKREIITYTRVKCVVAFTAR